MNSQMMKEAGFPEGPTLKIATVSFADHGRFIFKLNLIQSRG
jgi:hypothetical protein